MIRKAKIIDAKSIIELEKRYYDGYSISEDFLLKWIRNGNFYVSEENSKITDSIYFEYLDEIKDLPWCHEPISETGKYIYISEVGTDKDEINPDLFKEALKAVRENNCEGIIWLTGVKSNHDRIEQAFLKSNGFEKYKDVENWECSPNYFINDHSLWIKDLKKIE
jgi:hypothetical protein